MTTPDLAAERNRRTDRLLVLALLVALPAALLLGWIGFIASDDHLYYAGTIPWLDHPPFAGTDHWSTRFPLTLAFAGVIAVGGRNFAAFGATALLFYALLVGVAAVAGGRIGGRRTGLAAALLVGTMPVVVGHASTVSVDLAEAAALLGGILLLTGARTPARGVAAGALFGVAVLCRETSLLPLVGLAPFLFLRRGPVTRGALLWAALGGALVLGGEALFQYAMTGEPLRRYDLAFHHDTRIDRAANHEGNFLLWAPVDPLLVLLVNDDFGLLFWIAAAAGVSRPWRLAGSAGRRVLAVLGATALAMFVAVALLSTKLVLNPRYFTLPALAAALLLALWAGRGASPWRWWAVAALVATNLLLNGLGNAHPRWREEVTVAVAAAHRDETVWGVPNDVARAEIPIAFARVTNLRGGAAPAGGLEVADANPAPRGRVLARYPGPPTHVGAIVRWLRLDPLVPHAIARRLLSPSPAVVLVRRAG